MKGKVCKFVCYHWCSKPSHHLKEIKRSFGQNNTWPCKMGLNGANHHVFNFTWNNLRFPKELESNPVNCDNKDLFHRKKAFSNVLIMVQLLREVPFLDLNWKHLSQRNRWSEISFFPLFGVKWSFSADNCRLFCPTIFLVKLKLASRIIFSVNKGHSKKLLWVHERAMYCTRDN